MNSKTQCQFQFCGVGGVACFQLELGVVFFKLLESESGFQKCWSRSRLFKTAGVGVSFSKLLESESGVGILKNLPTPQPWSIYTHSTHQI